uniref:Uncharacterized protein n=1 Tax=Nelumbo nucifera TaxID=4432 RepID=A0A822Y4P0_NELNU|nr:TPA_asm: hypothetical protein HUJ06_028968 [Nelumbo nucifera]
MVLEIWDERKIAFKYEVVRFGSDPREVTSMDWMPLERDCIYTFSSAFYGSY